VVSKTFTFFTFYYVFQNPKNVTFDVFCFVAYVFSNNEYCSILYHSSSYLTLNDCDLEIWVIGHWRSFTLVPFQSVTSRRVIKIVELSKCGGWWTQSLWQITPDTWSGDCRALWYIRKPIIVLLQASAYSLCCILGRAKPYILIERNNWRRGKGRELANASAPNDWTGFWSLTQTKCVILYIPFAKCQ